MVVIDVHSPSASVQERGGGPDHASTGKPASVSGRYAAIVESGKIELEEALSKADSRDGLALKIRLAEGGGDGGDPTVEPDPFNMGAFG